MNDPDPSEPSPSGRLRSLFRFRRKPEPLPAPLPDGPADATPQVIRLRVDEFAQLKVLDVMVPRAEIKAVEVSTPLADLLRYFAEVTHSRLPVFRETLDEPAGFVHIKDLVGEFARENPAERRPLERLRREILFVPPSMPLSDLLVKMQATRIHIAIVVDEYGGTDGLVTLEDLVEEIVGDIEDEHDDDVSLFVRRSARIWDADARTEIEDFAEETGLDLGLAENDAEIDTLGGVAIALAGKVPLRGEILCHPSGVEFEILDCDARRIRRIRLRLPEPRPVEVSGK